MEERFKIAFQLTSHELATGNIPRSPAGSLPEFTSNTIYDEITPVVNQKKENLRSSLARDMTNTWPEPESFGDVSHVIRLSAMKIKWF